MDLTSFLTILAIISGPIAAVQVQKWKEGYKEKSERRVNVFKTLMATRGERVSFNHVRALNMIDIEFYDEKNITDAWKCYLDCLNEKLDNGQEQALKIWADKRDGLFVELLSEMAKSLGYHFDDVYLKKAVYTPRAHGEEEKYQYFIRDSIKKIFKGEQAIPIYVTTLQAQSDEAIKK